MSNVYENGQLTHTNVSFDNFVMYPSAFFVVDLTEDTYSKHYYAGGQRIAARMEQNNALFRENNDTSEDPKLSAAKTNAIEEDFKRYFKDKNVNISFDTQSYREGDIRAMSSSIEELYFYHPDHLGTATFLTDIVGNPYQFFLNLPFGESMAEQRSYTGGFDNRWLFTGKELDESTGLYYFGARFYNPSTSIWLSVDPLVEKTMDAYGYCYQNPINFIDPDGLYPRSILIYDPKLGLYGGYRFTESATHLLSLVSGVDKAMIKNAIVQERKPGQYRPFYSANKGGGAIVVGGSSYSGTITYTENWFEDDNTKYGGNGFGQDVKRWLRLSSHEVGHLPQINEAGGIFSYFGEFIKQYAQSGHDGAKWEIEADKGSDTFTSFNNFIDNKYGKDTLIKMFEATEEKDGRRGTEFYKINQIDKFWKEYQEHINENN